MVFPLLVHRLNPSPLLSCRRSLGRRSCVGTPRLLQGGLRLLSPVLSLILSLRDHFWVDRQSPLLLPLLSLLGLPRWFLLLSLLVLGGSFARCRPTRQLRSLLRFLLLSLFLWLLFLLLLLLLLCFLRLLFHLRLLLSLLNLWVLMVLSPLGLVVGGRGFGGDGGGGCRCDAWVSHA